MPDGRDSKAAAGASSVPDGRRRLLLVLIAVLLVAAGILGVAASRASAAAPSAHLILLIAVTVGLTLAGCLRVDYHYRGHRDSIDLFEAVLALALFSLPPVPAIAVAAVGKASSEILLRVSPVKAAFNVAQWTLAAAAGAWTLALLSPEPVRTAADLPALTVAMAVVIVVNSAAVATVLLVLGLWPRHLRTPLPTLAAFAAAAVPGAINLAWGLLLVAAHLQTPWAAPLLLLPLILLHWLQHGVLVHRGGREYGRALDSADALDASPGTDPRTWMPAFLAEVRSVIGSDVVELAVPRAGGVHIHHYGGSPEPSYSLAEAGPGEQHTMRDLLLHPPPATGVRAYRDGAPPALAALLRDRGSVECLAAPVIAGGRLYGVLLAYDQLLPVPDPDRLVAFLVALSRELGVLFERTSLLATVSAEKSKLEQIFNDTGDGIVTIDPDGVVHSWNPAFERITGYPAAVMVGTAGLGHLKATREDGSTVDFAGWSATLDLPQTLCIRTESGVDRWLNCTYSRSVDRTDPEHPQERLIVMARDVTDVRRAQRLLTAETEVLRLVAQGAPVERSLGVLAQAIASSGSGLGCAVFLASQGGDPLNLVASSGVRQPVLEALIHRAPSARGNGLERVLAGEGQVRIPDLSADPRYGPTAAAALKRGIAGCWSLPIESAGGLEVIGCVILVAADPVSLTDDTHADALERAAHVAAIAIERGRAERLLAKQARQDPLTGLVNRTVFLDRTSLALSRAPRVGGVVAVLFVDLDRFKLVNDSLGHEAGDRLLQGVADRLSAVLRPGDTVARFGGDEFTILCEALPEEEQVVELARRVDRIMAGPMVVGAAELFVTASIGVAVSNGQETAETLIGNADAAMYRAKQRGGHGFEIFDAAMRRRASERLDTQTAMHRALERSEFTVVYQPTVDLARGAITGVEALVRWRHPSRGMLAPGEFLDLAESSGLIVPMGVQVLRMACRQAFQWRTAGPDGQPLRMSINLSPRQFAQPNLPALVEQVLAETGVAPSTICLEITESAVMDDAESTVAAMNQLKALGVQLAIDDFGTGYSSFTYLKRFPVDELKVDRSFVNGLDVDSEDSAIVAAVINLAHSLRLSTVAEGVETPTQVERLRTLGCDAAQGYYFGRPAPARR